MKKKLEAKTVLILEDDPEVQKFISRLLELEGYTVLKANDSENGLDMMREKEIDLVLLDLRLPGRDGWSVLREMKMVLELAKIPVVVVTAVAEASQRKRTMKMGAEDYLIKPLSAQSLKNTVKSVIHHNGNHKSNGKESVLSNRKN